MPPFPEFPPHVNKWVCIVCYIGIFSTLGTGMAMLGPALPEIEKRGNVGLQSAGAVFGARGVAYMAGALGAGWVLEKKIEIVHKSLVLVTLLAGLGYVVLPNCTNFVLICISAGLAGLTEGFGDTSTNLLLIWLTADDMEFYLHVMHAGFALGALLGSPLLLLLGYHYSFYLIAVVFAVLAFLLMLTTQPERTEAPTTAAAAKDVTSKWLLVGLASCILMLYVGLEQGYGGLVWTMGGDEEFGNLTDSEATGITVGFWGSMALGRVVAGPLSSAFNLNGMNMVGLGLMLMLMSGGIQIALPDREAPLWVAAILQGLGLAPVFPATVAALESTFPLSGKEATVLMLGSASGGIVLPPLLAYLYATLGSTRGLVVIYSACTLSIVSIAVAFVLMSRSVKPAEEQHCELHSESDEELVSRKSSEREEELAVN
eukprot:TRINITY_DN13361_c0_g1_i1.p1 TRINITY_DN13361_c0_g1~~TRINITY_DN13361_c0_g1_i1.p1  ORF type:complete len:429 (+),score=64.72 TRINITY_DN13361_c0_g1_i1:72-1358(+)